MLPLALLHAPPLAALQTLDPEQDYLWNQLKCKKGLEGKLFFRPLPRLMPAMNLADCWQADAASAELGSKLGAIPM